MQYVDFGKTGLKISRLGFGGIPIQRIDQPGTRELLIAAHKAGVNYIDTARAYTVSEEWIGQSLEEAGLRDDFILATKCRALTKADMEAEIATSLKNLRTDHIEVFQFHNPSLEGLKTILAPGGAMEALLEAKAKGVVGHIGITAHLAAVFEAALDIPGMATVEELNANVAGSADTAPLTPAEEAACQAVRNALGTQFCRRCNYCAPCTVGISIPSVFLFQGYLNRYGLQQWGRERYATLQTKAGACIQCGACEPRCPYNLPIRQMMKKAAEDFGE